MGLELGLELGFGLGLRSELGLGLGLGACRMSETVLRSSRMCGVDQFEVEKMTHCVAVTTTRWCSLSDISVTRSLNCSSSCVSSSTLVTERLVASVCLTSSGPQLTCNRGNPRR